MKDNLKKMTETRAAAQDKMQELLDKIEGEQRAFTDDENALYDSLEKEINSITATIKAIQEGRKLTKVEEKPKESEGGSQVTEEGRSLEEKETLETREFADYIRNIVVHNRAESNLTTGDNGVIIPVTIANKIITKAYDMSPILDKATKYKTKGKLEIPVYGAKADGSDINMAYKSEFEELEGKAGKFGSVELTGFLAGALAKLSNSLINNTDIDLVNKVVELMAEAVVRFEENEGLNGTDGKITGCKDVELNVTTASATAITADELIKLKNKVKKIFRKNSIWVMSNDTLTAIELLKDDNGRFLFNEDLTGEFDGKILGYPAYVSDSMPEIVAGKTPILFGDFSGLALKQTADLEIQILREKYATQHATGIVAWAELDIKVEHKQKIAKLTVKEA